MRLENVIEKRNRKILAFADNKIHIYRCYQQRLTFIFFAQTKITHVCCAVFAKKDRREKIRKKHDEEKN